MLAVVVAVVLLLCAYWIMQFTSILGALPTPDTFNMVIGTQ